MPFSSGTFTPVYNWTTEAAAAPIEIAKLDGQDADMATGLSNCILRDGTGLPTATIPFNSQRISGLGDATAATDAMNRQTADARYLPSGSIATDRLLGRDTAGTGAPEALTVGGGVEFTGSGGIQRSALTGDVTASAGGGATTIATGAVTYAKMQNVSATSRVLGRVTAGAGNVEELTPANLLSFILTVDGAGSGLDADLLDGQSGAFYQSAANLNAGIIPDARIQASGVTQHQASLALAASQTTSGTFADARIAQTSITQHQASLSLVATQLTSGTIPDARFPATLPAASGVNLTALNATNLASGSIPSARVPAAAVTQHQASLALAASQLTSGTVPDARFPATLPAASGVNLTALNATQLTSGTVPTARITTLAVTTTINGGVIGYVDVPRRTSGFARGECTAISAGITLNTSDMSAGYTFSLYNDSASNVTITQGSGVTLRKSGTATTGSLTLIARGIVTIWCNSGTEAIASGNLG